MRSSSYYCKYMEIINGCMFLFGFPLVISRPASISKGDPFRSELLPFGLPPPAAASDVALQRGAPNARARVPDLPVAPTTKDKRPISDDVFLCGGILSGIALWLSTWHIFWQFFWHPISPFLTYLIWDVFWLRNHVSPEISRNRLKLCLTTKICLSFQPSKLRAPQP